MEAKAKLNNCRRSPRKVRLLADAIRGLDVIEAQNQLKFLVKGSRTDFEKLIASAIANAENNFGLSKENLYIKNILVNEGAKLKRWLPRAYGRATVILKRTSHIEMILAERIEGKGRKKVEKKKEIREITEPKAEEVSKKMEITEDKKEETTEIVKEREEKDFSDEKKKAAGARGFLKRVFRRKSM